MARSPGNPPSSAVLALAGGHRLGGMQWLRPGAVSAAASPRSATGVGREWVFARRAPPSAQLSADSPPSPASRLQHASSRRPLPVAGCTSLGIRLIPYT